MLLESLRFRTYLIVVAPIDMLLPFLSEKHVMRDNLVGQARHAPPADGASCRVTFLRSGYWAALLAALTGSVALAQHERSRFATEDTRADYVHRIDLYDSRNTAITAQSGRPYSPSRTCSRCHDVEEISHGFHFSVNPDLQADGRPGEPFIWVDPATGTQLPLTHREWKNGYSPDELGISPWDFTLRFGKRTAGGYPGLPAEERPKADQPAEPDGDKIADRLALSGPLEVDCMICHARGSTFDMESWSKQIDSQNFAWAPTAALGLAKVEGAVRRVPDSALSDPTAAQEHRSFPKTTYDPTRFDAEGKVFLDIVRTPEDNACYRCHTSILVGEQGSPAWMHEQDVHLRAGMKCVDCHANGLGHEVVRGFEGEKHPAQTFAASLSCRGCHMGTSELSPRGGGRLGAPFPEHRGLPPFHLDQLSCTACHAGSLPTAEAGLVHTSRNHLLGQSGHRQDHQQPEIVDSVLLPREEGMLYPYRVMWPSYWGARNDGGIVPLKLDEVQKTLRSVLRVRKDFVQELTRLHLTSFQRADVLGEERAAVPADELTPAELAKLSARQEVEGQRLFHRQLEKGLVQLKQKANVENPVYVAGEKLYQLDDAGNLEIIANPDSRPFAWPIGHDVRPARKALGANGCTDCHSADSPFLYASVTPEAAVPMGDLAPRPMHEFARVDEPQWSTWNNLLRAKPLLILALAGTATFLTTTLVTRGDRSHRSRAFASNSAWSLRERLSYYGFVVSVVLLGFTSVTSMWRHEVLEGKWLLAHMIVACFYLAFLVLVLLFVAHRFRPAEQATSDSSRNGTSEWAVSGFWLMMVLSLAVVGTILLDMLPFFGTEHQLLFVQLHRYSGLALLAAAVVHPFLLGKPREN